MYKIFVSTVQGLIRRRAGQLAEIKKKNTSGIIRGFYAPLVGSTPRRTRKARRGVYPCGVRIERMTGYSQLSSSAAPGLYIQYIYTPPACFRSIAVFVGSAGVQHCLSAQELQLHQFCVFVVGGCCWWNVGFFAGGSVRVRYIYQARSEWYQFLLLIYGCDLLTHESVDL